VKLKKIAVSLAAILAASAVVIAPGTPAWAATPLCTTAKAVVAPSGYDLDVPVASGGGASCILQQTDDSFAVYQLQFTLNLCYSKGLTQDSDFGPATKSALEAVQKKVGASPVDGIYGPETRGKMKFPVDRADGEPNFCLPWS
jgi:peptidoglycan hydrolase-like protein with peptidoglycan-binding domain